MKNISLNFGAIRDTVTRISSSELLSENESKTLKSFIKEVKKNPFLTKQHLFFKNMEDVKPFSKERLAERFLNQNLKLFSNTSWANILESNKILKNSLIGSEIHVDNFNDKNGIYESINVIIESVTRPGYNAIEKEQKAYEKLIEFLTRKEDETVQLSEEVQDYPDLTSIKFITKLAVNNFNKRYSHLNENEKKVLEMLFADDNNKVNYLKDLKNEINEKINKITTESEDKEYNEVLEGFSSKLNNIKEDNVFELDNYILSCIELNEELDNFN